MEPTSERGAREGAPTTRRDVLRAPGLGVADPAIGSVAAAATRRDPHAEHRVGTLLADHGDAYEVPHRHGDGLFGVRD